ncbi:MAG: proton-conducting membrane transporter [Lachnospiraceae bacterium]|nr:proton-conducting membrane transporter [Lachnospiraceae bacterium]
MTLFKGIKERKIKLGIVFVSLVVETAAFLYSLFGPEEGLMLWKLNDMLQITFRVDTMSRIFGTLVAVVWLLVGCFAFEYMKHEESEERFFGFYLVVEGTLAALTMADNMITYYIFFEAMTLTSLPLVLHEMHKAAVMAGLKYLFYSIAGGFMALLAVFLLANGGGLGSFTAGGILDPASLAERPGAVLAAAMLLVLGFGTKAGMFPMHGWLPTAHPEAPAPASAVLSGIITKMGVLGIIRGIYYVIGPSFLKGTWVQTVWLILSISTVFMGSMLAYREKVMKKRLAYSTVSQVSYILFGLAVMDPAAFTGAIAHVIFHSLVKNTLFLAAGAIIYKTGKTLIADLKAIGKEMPVVIWCFTLVSLTLVGIPPTSGFVSKWYLATGALASGVPVFSWLGPVILLVSALLTAGYLLPVTIHGFFPGADFDYSTLKKKEPTLWMLIPMVIMTAGAVIYGIFPESLLTVIRSAAQVLFG